MEQITAPWKSHDKPTHPLKGSRWVDQIVEIKCNETGEVRQYADDCAILDDGAAHPSDFIWEGGNNSCDCNRRLYFLRAGNEEREEDFDESECSEGKFSVRLVHPVTGQPYYAEF